MKRKHNKNVHRTTLLAGTIDVINNTAKDKHTQTHSQIFLESIFFL